MAHQPANPAPFRRHEPVESSWWWVADELSSSLTERWLWTWLVGRQQSAQPHCPSLEATPTHLPRAPERQERQPARRSKGLGGWPSAHGTEDAPTLTAPLVSLSAPSSLSKSRQRRCPNRRRQPPSARRSRHPAPRHFASTGGRAERRQRRAPVDARRRC